MLCRIHVQRERQLSLEFHGERTPGEILNEAIWSRPGVILRLGTAWSIANVRSIDERSLYFRIGCEKYKEQGAKDEAGDFVSEVHPVAPHTHVILDWDLEVCAIAPNSELGDKRALPSRLKKLLNESETAKTGGYVFDVRPIDNPEEFVRWIGSASRVTRYEMTFCGPNFFDVNEDFQKPLQRMAENIKGNDNKVVFQNQNGLEPDGLVPLSRAVIAAGNVVSAKCQTHPDGKLEKRSSKGNPATVEVDTLEDAPHWKTAIDFLRSGYRDIRYGEEHNGGEAD